MAEVDGLNESPLTAEECSELAELEGRVQRGLAGAVDAGEALEQIKERCLYRATHVRWADYVRERWHIDLGTANAYIAARRVQKHLASALPGVPAPGLAAATALYSLALQDPEAVGSVYAEAVEKADGQAPTADGVKAIVRERQGRRTDDEIVHAYASGEPGTETPKVEIVLSLEEARRLGEYAEQKGIRLHEAARRLLNKALAMVADV